MRAAVIGTPEVRRRAGDVGGHGAERQIGGKSDCIVGVRRLPKVASVAQTKCLQLRWKILNPSVASQDFRYGNVS